MLLEFGEDELIDVVVSPGFIFDGGRSRASWLDERPVLFVFGSLGDPVEEDLLFGLGKSFAGGISASSVALIRAISSLSFGLPGTMAVCPLLSLSVAPLKVSSRSPAAPLSELGP